MALWLKGADFAETGHWTAAMRDSGLVHDLSRVPGRKVDKHSTGGVGDKVSLVLAPLVASCAVPVPMVSGRGLGHTGGTVDKLESIPGFRMQLSPDEYVATLERVGLVMSAATDDLAPADRRMYATRDVTGTVESIPLITASILSKKLAEGIDALVLDVKCGAGAFMKSREDARALATSLVETSTGLGVPARALVTDMDAPLGAAVGNALEVRESLDCLRGRGPAVLREISVELGIEMLLLAEACATREEARARLEAALADGSALECFGRMVEAQGGDPRVVEDPDGVMGVAPHIQVLRAESGGQVAALDALAIAWVALELGAGRRRKSDAIDPQVGLEVLCERGQRIAAGDELFRVHARTEADLVRACADLPATIQLDAEAPEPRPLVLERIEPGAAASD
jgi:pyrimidine-nucleoside phosphorylase